MCQRHAVALGVRLITASTPYDFFSKPQPDPNCMGMRFGISKLASTTEIGGIELCRHSKRLVAGDYNITWSYLLKEHTVTLLNTRVALMINISMDSESWWSLVTPSKTDYIKRRDGMEVRHSDVLHLDGDTEIGVKVILMATSHGFSAAMECFTLEVVHEHYDEGGADE
jgi:hypothetical protein